MPQEMDLRLKEKKMIYRVYFYIFFTFLFLSSSLFGTDGNRPTLVEAPVSTVYAPGGFDDNDNIQIVIEGIFPNTCYKSGPSKVSVTGERIQIVQQAYYYDGHCFQMMVPYEKVIDIGILKAQNYGVFVADEVLPSALLPVKEAKNDKTDDHLYAPVKKAELVSKNPYVLELMGIFPNRMMQIDHVIVSRPLNNVIDVLPIARVDERRWSGVPDSEAPVPFTHAVDLSSNIQADMKESRRFLIHIRSLNGQSVNLIEDF